MIGNADGSKIDRRTALAALSGVVVLTALAASVSAKPKSTVFTGIVSGVGAGGYDVVQYFEQGKPVAGDASFTAKHDGATWRFVDAASRDKFLADPARYAPQYGGYCAWAVAEGYTAKGDPNAWSIVAGKLYLNYNTSVRATWERDTARNIARGDANWPKVLTK